MKTRCLVILETMWGGSGKAPGLFHINPENHTGRRLYWLLAHEDVWVTNAGGEYVSVAKEHGTPDAKRLTKTLKRLEYNLLLICGAVAKKTYGRSSFRPKGRKLIIAHPAWRFWTNEELEKVRKLIQKGAH